MEDNGNFRKCYKISKTLRFELKPMGKTLENFKQNKILEQDEEKYILSFEIKKLLDEFYKEQIEILLSREVIPKDLLLAYFDNLEKKDDVEIILNSLKRIIINLFKTNDNPSIAENTYKALTSNKVFSLLENYLKERNRLEDIKLLNKFKGYSTYFTDFFKNREHCFIGDTSGSISYRLINENLITYKDNIKVYERITDPKLKKEINDIINKDFFKIDNYNNVLTQKEIEKYNVQITGYSLENKNIQGLNVIINNFNLQNKTKYPLFKVLNKQILSDTTTSSFTYEPITNDEEIYKKIDEFLANTNIINFFNNFEYDLNKIMIRNSINLTELSQKIYNDWNEINNHIYEWYQINIDSNIDRKNYFEKRKKYLKNKKYFTIDELNNILNINLIEEISNMSQEYISKINEYINSYRNINFNSINNLKKDPSILEQIKNLLDSIKEYQIFLNQFYVNDPSIEKDISFYNFFDENYLNIKNIISIYNKIRNYVTKKPYDISKIILKFNKPTLLNGWDLNKEKDHLGIIFRKINTKRQVLDTKREKFDYFLGILRDNKIFDNLEETKSNDYYEKMEYKLFPGANKMLPKLFISAKKYKEKLSEKFLKDYNEGKHTKQNFDKHFLTEYIAYMQEQLKDYYKNEFDFNFRLASDYKQVDEFYRDVEEQGYCIKFKKIDSNYINQCIDNNQLYLFQIYSKDFSEYSKGLPNNQTIYLESLFSEKNLEQKNFRLNGEAEMFYRKASLEYKETHKSGEILNNKNIDNKKKFSKFNYPLVKDRRYTTDKFLFHFPITINANNSNDKNINTKINENINSFQHIIGIDRGREI